MVQQSLIVHGHFVFDSTLVLLKLLALYHSCATFSVAVCTFAQNCICGFFVLCIFTFLLFHICTFFCILYLHFFVFFDTRMWSVTAMAPRYKTGREMVVFFSPKNKNRWQICAFYPGKGYFVLALLHSRVDNSQPLCWLSWWPHRSHWASPYQLTAPNCPFGIINRIELITSSVRVTSARSCMNLNRTHRPIQ